MAKVQLKDGRIIEIVGEVTPEKVASVVKQLSSTDPARKPVDPFLPGTENVEKRIAQRTSVLEDIGEGLENKPVLASDSELFGGLLFGLMGELRQRGEAFISNAAMAMQRGKDIGQIGREAVDGIRGERLGEVGDVTRSVLPEKVFGISTEPIAATLGVIQSAALGDVFSKRSLTKGFQGLKTMIRRERMVSSINKNNKFFLNQAKQLDDALNNIDVGLKTEFRQLDKILESKPLTNQDNINRVNQIVGKMPANVIRKVKARLELNDIEEFVGNNARIVNELKKSINEAVPYSVRVGRRVATSEQRQMMGFASELRGILAGEIGDESVKLMDDLFQRNTTFQPILKSLKSSIKDANGDFKTSQLKDVFSQSSEGKLDVVQRLGEISPKVIDMLADINKFNKRQAMRNMAGNVARRVIETGTVGYVGGRIGAAIGQRDN